MTVFDMYVDSSTPPEAIVKMTQADIETALSYAFDKCGVGVAENIAHDILMEARRRVLVAAIDNEEDIVAEEWGCPKCDERRADELVWAGGKAWQPAHVAIECQTCGAKYTLD